MFGPKRFVQACTIVLALAGIEPVLAAAGDESPEDDPAAALAAGQELYLSAGGYGCLVCHGQVAHGAGQVGGMIRGATLAQFQTSLEQVPVMALLAPSLSMTDRLNIVEYLNYLGDLPLVSLTYRDGHWQAQTQVLQVGQWAQLVLYNDSFETQSLDLAALGLATLAVPPLATLDRLWRPTSASFALAGVAPIQAMPLDLR
ncbi:MAG: hypothetical protein MUQ43_11145 [Reinekea forsetii]|nr:hypothetical protein [Reinekea forsetii]